MSALQRILNVRALALGVSLTLTFLYTASPGTVRDGLEAWAWDGLLRLAPRHARESRLVLVDVDEKSLAEIGPWPWPRERIAHLVRTLLDDQQAALVGLDMVFPESRPGDDALRAASADPRVVLSEAFDLTRDSLNQAGSTGGFQHFSGTILAPPAHGYVANATSVLPDAPRVGHISPLRDADGRVRRIYPVLCHARQCVGALSLRIYQMLAGDPPLSFAPDGRRLRAEADGVLDLPLDAHGALPLVYPVVAGGFHTVSAADVLGNRLAPGALARLPVLVGSTALGLGDRIATPFDAMAPGLEIHAQVLSALLDQTTLTPVAPGWAWLSGGAVLLALSWLFWPWRGGRGIAAWVLATGGGVTALEAFLFLHLRIAPPLTPLPVAVASLGLAALLLESDRISRQLRHVATQFNHFLPSALVDRLLGGAGAAPGTERRTLTVLFADVRGFTESSEQRSPDDVAQLAQHCLDTLARVVAEHQGTIEKYTGDGLMAIWGTPLSDHEHARHAVDAGCAMQKAMREEAPWFTAHGFRPLSVSVGINTGVMAVGLFGGDTHLMWSAHGDAVNVASRIEQLTRATGEPLLMGEDTAHLYGLARTRRCGAFPVKGRQGEVAVYAPVEAQHAPAES